MLAGNFQFLSVPSKSIHPVYQLNTTGLIRKGYFKNKEGKVQKQTLPNSDCTKAEAGEEIVRI